MLQNCLIIIGIDQYVFFPISSSPVSAVMGNKWRWNSWCSGRWAPSQLNGKIFGNSLPLVKKWKQCDGRTRNPGDITTWTYIFLSFFSGHIHFLYDDRGDFAKHLQACLIFCRFLLFHGGRWHLLFLNHPMPCADGGSACLSDRLV